MRYPSFLAILLLVLVTCLNNYVSAASSMDVQGKILDCTAKDATGPKTIAEKKQCRRVLVPGEIVDCIDGEINSVRHIIACEKFHYGRIVNCLSSSRRGPQDGAELNMCRRVPVYINCLSTKLDGPQDGADLNICQNQVRN